MPVCLFTDIAIGYIKYIFNSENVKNVFYKFIL